MSLKLESAVAAKEASPMTDTIVRLWLDGCAENRGTEHHINEV